MTRLQAPGPQWSRQLEPADPMNGPGTVRTVPDTFQSDQPEAEAGG